MLRITVLDSGAQKMLVVEGKLAGCGAAELQSTWKEVRHVFHGYPILVDLSGATVIDASGKATLLALIGEGALLTAKGLYTQYLIETLMAEAREGEVLK